MTARELHEAVQELPGHQRELIELVYWRGCSAPEIAARLGISRETVRQLTRNALSELSRSLG